MYHACIVLRSGWAMPQRCLTNGSRSTSVQARASGAASGSGIGARCLQRAIACTMAWSDVACMHRVLPIRNSMHDIAWVAREERATPASPRSLQPHLLNRRVACMSKAAPRFRGWWVVAFPSRVHQTPQEGRQVQTCEGGHQRQDGPARALGRDRDNRGACNMQSACMMPCATVAMHGGRMARRHDRKQTHMHLRTRNIDWTLPCSRTE